MVVTWLHHDATDIDISETAIGLCAQFDGVAMARYHAVGNANILAEAWRGALQCDGIIVGIGKHIAYHHFMASVEVEGIVVVVVAVEHLYAVNLHTVASQIVLHPATGVLQCDVA